MKTTIFKTDLALLEQFYTISNIVYKGDPNFVKSFTEKEIQFWNQLEQDNLKFDFQNIIIEDESGVIQARCSAIVNHELKTDGYPIGMIGYFESVENFDITSHLIKTAEKILQKFGCKLIYAPINFTTWYNYRFKINNFDHPRYLFEPYNPEYYPKFFETLGYKLDRRYFSKDIETISVIKKNELKRREAANNGIKVRPINLSNFESEIHKLFKLTINSFQTNHLYTPISFETFRELYLPYKHLINPKLFAIAEDDHNMVGFLFCMPDLFTKLQALDGSFSFLSKLKFLFTRNRSKLLLAKSMAVLPEFRHLGIGGAMMHFCHTNALKIGFKLSRHCLFIDDNFSGTYSQSDNKNWEYALFNKELP